MKCLKESYLQRLCKESFLKTGTTTPYTVIRFFPSRQRWAAYHLRFGPKIRRSKSFSHEVEIPTQVPSFSRVSSMNISLSTRAQLQTFRRFCSVPCLAYNHPTLLPLTMKAVSSRETHAPNQVNVVELNSHLKDFVKTGRLIEARRMFDKMPERDAISWTTMISGYVSSMGSTEALVLFSDMRIQPGLELDPFILSVALKACAHGLSVSYGTSLHGYSTKTGFLNSVFVGSSLLDMYMKVGRMKEGCRVFDEMPLRNVVSWTAVITGLVHAGCHDEGLAYFGEMGRQKVGYDSYTLAIALKACADSGCLIRGKEVHTHAIKNGFDVTSFVVNSLATMYNKCGRLDYGLHLFKKMTSPDVVSWTSIITTYFQTGKEENSIKAFKEMRVSGVSANEFTFAAVISSCANLLKCEWGEQLHAHIARLGLIDYLSVANSLMTMYSKCGQLRAAARIFHRLKWRDIISWTTMIVGFSQGGYGEEAFEYLSWMRREGPKPNEFAFSTVLSVCGNMAILDQGREVHAHVLSVGLEQTALVRCALINMYSKCGSLKEAVEVFSDAEDNDIVSWTTMINGYAEHGYSQEAIDLFEQLPHVGLTPDQVSFLGVLIACSHAGLVDLGFHYLNLMRNRYSIKPSKQHYGCIIDLLCRAGRLKEAENMIKEMPFQIDDVVWSTLLRACRLLGDVECGRRVAEKILELDPNCAVTHITMASMLAAKGKWTEAADVRKKMRSKGLIKEPGWSWIKLKDCVTAFVAGDRSHPEGEGIYWVLDLLAKGQYCQRKSKFYIR